MATNKSISFDDDIVFDLQHKAKELNLNLSQITNKAVDIFLHGNPDDAVFDINKYNNNILILSNKILLLCDSIGVHLQQKIDEKNIELKNIQEEEKKIKTKYKEEFDNLVKKFKENDILKEIDEVDVKNWTPLVEKFFSKGIKIGGYDIITYHRLKTLLKPKQ